MIKCEKGLEDYWAHLKYFPIFQCRGIKLLTYVDQDNLIWSSQHYVNELILGNEVSHDGLIKRAWRFYIVYRLVLAQWGWCRCKGGSWGKMRDCQLFKVDWRSWWILRTQPYHTLIFWHYLPPIFLGGSGESFLGGGKIIQNVIKWHVTKIYICIVKNKTC